MALHIELTPEQEARLNAVARHNGIAPAEALKKLLDAHLPSLSPGEEPAQYKQQDIPGDPKARVRALLSEWQTQDNTPTLPLIPTQNSETPTQALFRKWEEEDAAMTDEEREAEDRLWKEFQQSINAERAKAGMRTLF